MLLNNTRKKFMFKKSIPLYLAISLIINSVAVTGLLEYYFMRKYFNKQIAKLIQQNKNPEDLIAEITRQVTPSEGYTTSIKWGDIGKKLIESGAIDKAEYEEIFNSNTNGQQEMDIFNGNSNKKISINENNSRFIVNTLWALGLVNKSKVLSKGVMNTGQYADKTGNFASTGGWTLGAKDSMQLYSSQEIIPLTDKQQDLVKKIAENIYRPCCGNHTAFPDCNHGMAALGYIELAVAKGLSEEQIYKDLLAFNSFWFTQNYIEMAVYFQKEKNITWDKVDAKLALSQEYSSAQGAKKIKQAVQNVAGLTSQGGGCGV